MSKRGLAIGAIIGALAGALVGGGNTIGISDPCGAFIFVTMGAGAGILIGGLTAPFIALIWKVQSIADLPDESEAVHREENAAESDQWR